MNKKILYWVIGALLVPLPFLVFYGIQYSKRKVVPACLRKDALFSERRDCEWKSDPFAITDAGKMLHGFGKMVRDSTEKIIELKATAPVILDSKYTGVGLTSKVVLFGFDSKLKTLNKYKFNSKITPSRYTLKMVGFSEDCFYTKTLPVIKIFETGAKFKIQKFIGLPTGRILIQMLDENDEIVDLDEDFFKIMTLGCEKNQSHICFQYKPFLPDTISKVHFDDFQIKLANQTKILSSQNLQSLLAHAYKRLTGEKIQIKIEGVKKNGYWEGRVSGNSRSLNILQSCGLIFNTDEIVKTTTSEENEWFKIMDELRVQFSNLPESKPTRDDLKEAEKLLGENPEILLENY